MVIQSNTAMRIVFRVDASIQMGTGHVMRCLTLADALKKQGAECYFICREHPGNLIGLITQRGHHVDALPYIDLSQEGKLQNHTIDLAHASWLGSTQKEDSSLCIPIVEALKPDWLVVDHYALDVRWEKALRLYCKKVMIIDDLADRQHDCDILIDQNYLSLYEQRYDHLVPVTTKKLLGPSFVLLRDEFSALRKKILKPTLGAEAYFLINFGGVGNYFLLSKVIEAINIFQQESFFIVTGKLEAHQFLELRKAISYSKVKIVETTINIANLMSQSQYAIGACGSTVWERFCLGLNSGLIEMAENQTPLLNYLTKMNLIDNLGNVNSLTTDDILKLLQNLDLTDAKYSHRKTAIMSLIDGKGTQRVVEIILEVANV
ncbi:UDP-2,4-diacetamido-2,4,6-trideoxy-beta-L-altropyranose hydrolase [Acinetobacter radioresistens]|uniref:UDP-2,4-diacetamido-2,4, 6-trideoxy-beta-L-altropyranose hydrolase n=1 Tax=Acinetobacter radioresistens TaxID=40216 RepID=UPI0020059357|nr:UDP-2,4-diacetamido-2,4,6-trideoxy-beta-L-altropyranose hydrolase [Acinetobacter radioresistens]MCK4102787.1 UDP-2,4-diacetamido-2,4,6-trideoxy-beta-L-altropyranose hydrolase [Acinetobacter radioresistens]